MKNNAEGYKGQLTNMIILNNYSIGFFGMTKPFFDGSQSVGGADSAGDNKQRRTPGPLSEHEEGVKAGDVVVPAGKPVFIGGGGGTRRLKRDIRLPLPLDKAEVGTAWNEPGVPVPPRSEE